MKLTIVLTIGFVLLSFTIKAYPQNPDIPVTLLLDRYSYNAGDELVLGIGLNDATQLGITLRADLINPYFHVIGARMLKMDTVLKFAGFPLSDTLAQGPYCLRVYAVFADLTISEYHKVYFEVINPKNEIERMKLYRNSLRNWRREAGLKSSINVEVYPEGGSFVPGAKQKMALFIRDELGKGISGDWELMPTGIKFKTNHQGWGICTVEAYNPKGYYLVSSQGEKIKWPELIEGSISMEVLKEHATLKIQLTPNPDQRLNEPLTFEAITEIGQISNQKIRLTNMPPDSIPSLNIRLSKISGSWVYLRIVDSRGHMLADRFIPFVVDPSGIDSKPIILNENESPSQKLSVIQPCWLSVQTWPPNQSLAVAKYYADQTSFPMTKSQAISLRMKDWQQALNFPQALAYTMGTQRGDANRRQYYSPYVRGQIVRDIIGVPVAGVDVLLYDLSDYFAVHQQITNTNGEFFFDLPSLKDSSEIVLEALNRKSKKAYVFKLELLVSPPVQPDPNMLAWFSGRLDESPIPSHRSSDDTLHVGSLHQRADQVLYLDESVAGRYNSVLDYLEGRAPGVEIEGYGSDRRAIIRGPGSIYGRVEAYYLIDDVPASRQSVNALNPADVERIEIIKNASGMAIYGFRGGNGVIAIYTRHGAYGSAGEFRMTVIGFHDYVRDMTKQDDYIYWGRLNPGSELELPANTEGESVITTFWFEDGVWKVSNYEMSH